MLGIPTDLMTPIFALARMAGWTAHVREQYADNRVIRPGSEYVGPRDQRWVPIEERGPRPSPAVAAVAARPRFRPSRRPSTPSPTPC